MRKILSTFTPFRWWFVPCEVIKKLNENETDYKYANNNMCARVCDHNSEFKRQKGAINKKQQCMKA